MMKALYQSAFYPEELKAMVKIKLNQSKYERPKEPLETLAMNLDDKAFCYAALSKVSRSFAVVIQQLPEELKDPVCIFYLILRALDTVEDDMELDEDKKLALLSSFHQKSYDPDFRLTGIGDQHDYRVLLEHYHKVIRVFLTLDEKYQKVIEETCQKMAEGMIKYAEGKVETYRDFDDYCYYVAGLVGIGLSGLFSASAIESSKLQEETALSNDMGLFLQKTNIIRDYHEDLIAERLFWPSEHWTKYATTIDAFHKNPESEKSLLCLNTLVENALQHAKDSLHYMSMLQNVDVFRFCAIPQVMAIATLAEVYNNPKVFTSTVKIRKGLAAKIMLDTNDMEVVKNYFLQFAVQIQSASKHTSNQDHKTRINDLVETIKSICKSKNYQFA